MIHPLSSTRPDTAARRAAALRRAAVHAAQAPSVLNTQPWKLRIHEGALYVYADHRRQLAALDPQRRVLTTSVGCAVFNARAALATEGFGVTVRRFPDLLDSELTAVIDLDPEVAPDTGLSLPAAVLATRYRRAELPVEALEAAASAEGGALRLLDQRERAVVSDLNRQADEIENLDPTYRAELDAWSPNDRTSGPDGAPSHDFLAVLVSDGDAPMDWLRAGEAMMRVRQVAAAAGHELSPSSQAIEVASARAQLRRALRLPGHAQLLLRSGTTGGVPTSRRRLVDVLVEGS